MCFHKEFHDWELESVNSFLEFFYSQLPKGMGCNRMRWRLNGSGMFDVHSYYKDFSWNQC